MWCFVAMEVLHHGYMLVRICMHVVPNNQLNKSPPFTQPKQGTPTIQQLKVRFYELSIQYNGHNNNYLEMARNYRAIYESPEIASDEQAWVSMLKKICWLVLMAPVDSDQVTLLQLTREDKKLSSLPLYKQLLHSFTKQEVVDVESTKRVMPEYIYAITTNHLRYCGIARLRAHTARNWQPRICFRALRVPPANPTCACV